MKALILTCNTGEGHNQTAKAIITEFNALGFQCDSVDALNFLSEKKSKFLCSWHLTLYRHLPKTSSVGYSLIDKNPKPLEKSGRWLYKFFAKGADKLNELINAEKYDLIISVHPFSAVIIAGFQEKYKETKVKTAFVATDYTCSPGAASGNIDTYFIPHESLREDFVKRGISNEKIVSVCGIPVKNEFFSAPSVEEAKESIGLNKDSKVVLLTFGSMGCGPIYKLTLMLSRSLPHSTSLFVICGTNKSLLNKLKKKNLPKNVTVLGYTDKMLQYCVASDVYITKPGGISSTEAAVLGVPTIFVNAVGGCETYNCNFFVNNKTAKTSNNLKELVGLILDILNGNDSFSKNAQNLKKEFSKCSAKIIAEHYANSESEKK